MSANTDIFLKLLKQAHCRTTKARLLVFECLQAQQPLAMHELVTLASSIDRASVYRAVELFERLGIAQRVHIGWKYKVELTDAFAAHHHHLTCIRCGKTISINEQDFEQFIDKLAARHHFKPTSHQIELQGYCGSCQRLLH